MRFGIIANPTAGGTSTAQKRRPLQRAAAILGEDTILAGLDTTSLEDFIRCARDLAERIDVLVVAGGDGTFSDIINNVAPETVLSYMPFGSGCALRYALELPVQLPRIAEQIKDGRLHELDLILCDDSIRAFMASVGLEGDILNRRESLRDSGVRGPGAYAMATVGSILTNLERTEMTIEVDGKTFVLPYTVTAIVTKIPYYGYNMKMVPKAVFDDGRLHLMAINAGVGEIVQNLAHAFLGENKTGTHRSGREIRIQTPEPRQAQTDGNLYRKGKDFNFRVLPRALKMWY